MNEKKKNLLKMKLAVICSCIGFSSISSYYQYKTMKQIIKERKIEDTKLETKHNIAHLSYFSPSIITEVLKKPIQQYYNIPIYSVKEQKKFFEISDRYKIPHEILFTIGHVESAGTWSTNGMTSIFGGNYGLFQINYSNLNLIYQNLGYTKDDILNNPYKNAEAACYLLTLIFDLYGYDQNNFDYENVFGTYNGYIYWKNIGHSVQYVNACMNILEEKYSKIKRVTQNKKR